MPECNGNGEHIAIIYNHDPCPLCASHSDIATLEAALRGLVEAYDVSRTERGTVCHAVIPADTAGAWGAALDAMVEPKGDDDD